MKSRALWEHSRHYLNVRPIYALGAFLLENLPLAGVYAIVRMFSEIAYRSSRTELKSLHANVAHVLRHTEPGLSREAVERKARSLTHRIFVHRGHWFGDLSVLAGRRSLDGLIKFRTRGDWSKLEKTLSSGRGAFLTSAHLGNWHVGGLLASGHGAPVHSVLYRNHAGDFMDDRVAKRGKVSLIRVDGDQFSSLEIIRALRKGAAVAILADKPWDSQSIKVPFFGEPCEFPVGPIRFARLAGVPIFPAFCIPSGRLQYTATICDPIEVRGGDRERAEREALEKLVRVMEDFVASNLAFWFNFTPQWDSP